MPWSINNLSSMFGKAIEWLNGLHSVVRVMDYLGLDFVFTNDYNGWFSCRYRGKRMRIDYFILSEKLKDRIVACEMQGKGIELEGASHFID